ncbi:hypothetical protein FEM48_ZijujUnG0015600 [Ziziphus jujuba var. spinosa]|uniref:Sucrose-phosphatase n=1 Tax=Ziziphus jujuba var. spinosa TaxID=714518 RepID=A0A978U9W0_ZIZJJ|nr:hypothetical protein FEM48_ZijujUnG0015600 [Ziziphus jujuba var. spinosa]
MERLHGSTRLMVVSDLDSTMVHDLLSSSQRSHYLVYEFHGKTVLSYLQVDHDDPDDISLLSFNALCESYYRHDSLLVFSTGRSPTSYKLLRNEKPLLTPDVVVMSMGTEIAYGEALVVDTGWEEYLNHKWDREIIVEETSKFLELTPQSEIDQRPLNVSFYVEEVKALAIIDVLAERLEKLGASNVKIIYSSGIALDVLPRGAGKGQALAYLMKKFALDGKLPANTLVCGDSGNDAELFNIPEVYGVMVSNAKEELLQWYAENMKSNPYILRATDRCAAGIIKPLYSLGTFVHPSGIEQPIHQCIDAMESLHGDRQGKRFQVWVDQLSSAQIGSDTWLVKCKKWKSYGEIALLRREALLSDNNPNVLKGTTTNGQRYQMSLYGYICIKHGWMALE